MCCKKVLIPMGYKYVYGTVNEGLVVQSPEGNQFVYIPGGETKQDGYCESFYISRYEVSQENVNCFVSKPDKHPIIDLSYYEAKKIAEIMQAKIMTDKQFERIIYWLVETGDKTEYEVYEDSSELGNYINTGFFRMAKTGENPKWMIKNIDNLAGNTYSWTSTGDDDSKIIRGGACNLKGYYVPLARKTRSYLRGSRFYLGLRVVL